MPASRRARKTLARAPKPGRRAGPNLTSLLLDIEQPLRDVTLTVEALRLVGHGLSVEREVLFGANIATPAPHCTERLPTRSPGAMK